jgi:hypothetical protein
MTWRKLDSKRVLGCTSTRRAMKLWTGLSLCDQKRLLRTGGSGLPGQRPLSGINSEVTSARKSRSRLRHYPKWDAKL